MAAMVELMSATEQVDREFAGAKRRARLHMLGRRLAGATGGRGGSTPMSRSSSLPGGPETRRADTEREWATNR